MEKIVGRVLKFGDNIDTTVIAPIETADKDLKKALFGAIRPNFYQEVRENDVIVAGTNFGCGSQREQACSFLKELGIRAIFADSIARIYFRNCMAIGLPAVPCRGVTSIFNEGDTIEAEISTGKIENLTTGKILSAKPLPPDLVRMLDQGGIVPLLISRLQENNSS